MVWAAVGGGLAEPVLVTSEAPLQLGPPFNLSLVTTQPRIALFGTRSVGTLEGDLPELSHDVDWRVFDNPAPEVGVLAVGRGDIIG